MNTFDSYQPARNDLRNFGYAYCIQKLRICSLIDVSSCSSRKDFAVMRRISSFPARNGDMALLLL